MPGLLEARALKITKAQFVTRCVAVAALLTILTAVGGVRDMVSGESERLNPLGIALLAPAELLSDSQVAIQVTVTDHAAGVPAAKAEVAVRLTDGDGSNPRRLFVGRTDDRGVVEAKLAVPDLPSGDYVLDVRARHGGDQDTLQQKVKVRQAARILLTTDKPIYQPGQVMHLRALALKLPTMKAVAKRDIILEVSDAKSNKVFKRTIVSNDFGIAAADFQLADEVNMGRYVLRAALGSEEVEKTVTVSRYVLPKFKVTAKTDRDYYLPRDQVKGTVQADYFFGKPVAGGKVQVSVKTFDVQLNEIAKLEGRTDDNGTFEFETRLPDSFVGQPVEGGNAYLQFDVKVTDQAQHTESITQTAAVSQAALNINAVPESGRLIPGVENIVYVIVSRPNGEPCPATVTVNKVEGDGKVGRQTIDTDELGIAEVRYTPTAPAAGNGGAEGEFMPGMGARPNIMGPAFRRLPRGEAEEEGQPYVFDLSAQAKDGTRASRKVSLNSDPHSGEQAVLVRCDKALYRVGDSVEVTILTPAAKGSVYVDLVKDRQTLLTRTVDVSNGRGRTSIPVTADTQGTVYLSAYRITPQQDIVRCSRPIFVQPASDLKIDVQADKDTYKPGGEAKLAFAVTDSTGKPVAAALGINVVDEAVFALQEIQPGMEKVYFYLEQELMKPRYEIHSFELPHIITKAPGGPVPLEDARTQAAAKVVFASVQMPALDASPVDTYAQRLAEARATWAKELQPRIQRISAALEKANQAANPMPMATSAQAVAALKAAGLAETDLLDLWGHEMRAHSPAQGAEHPWLLVMQSAGPDGKFGTEDDLLIGTDGVTYRSLDEVRQLRQRAVWKAGMAVPLAMAAPGMPGGMGGGVGGAAGGPVVLAMDGAHAAGGPAAPPVKVREFFPETMFVEPSLITDEAGKATLTIPMADSITSWRLAAMANSQAGLLGSTTKGLRCFQDFFIDIDLPVSLTQNDQVSIPVAVYNYLPEKQTVSLELTAEDWFTLAGNPKQEMQIGANDVDVAYFTISAKAIGSHKLTVHGIGTKMSDAISRQIEIRPDGKEVETTVNDRLSGDVTKTVNLPEAAVPGASDIFVKVYPGILSQVVEGLDSILRMPSGCFEQTSSTTYPNILVLDYLKTTKKASPEVQMKAEGFINTGYQRLVSFEVKGGGFSWFGDAPANKILTAYGIMEFHDMAAVHEVDPNLITRTQKWLLTQQQADGSFKPDEAYLHQDSWARIQNNNLPPTAYVTWALAHSGCSDPGVQKAVQYLRGHWREAKEAYTLSIVANALVSSDLVLAKGDLDDSTIEVLSALRDMAKTEVTRCGGRAA